MKTVVIDASPLIYAIFNSPVGRFSTADGTPTGLRFGFLRSVRSYATKLRAQRVVVVYDSPNVLKAEGNSEYKANRVNTPEKDQMWAQVPALKEAIALTNWFQMEADGYEADDIIGHVSRSLVKKGIETVVITPDNDMVQLVAEGVKIWMPPKGKAGNTYKDQTWIWKEYGVPANALLLWRAICGDTSDNIAPAVTNKGLRASLLNLLRGADRKVIFEPRFVAPNVGSEALARLEKNYEIMRLHRVPKEALQVTKGKGDPDALRALFEDLEIKSLIPHVHSFTGTPDHGAL